MIAGSKHVETVHGDESGPYTDRLVVKVSSNDLW